MRTTVTKLISLAAALMLALAIASASALADKSTSIHVHVGGDSSKVSSVKVLYDGVLLTLSHPGNSGNWSIKDGGKYVVDKITAVYLNDEPVAFEPGVEANGTINIWVTYVSPEQTPGTETPAPTPETEQTPGNETPSPTPETEQTPVPTPTLDTRPTPPTVTDPGSSADEIPLGTPLTGGGEVLTMALFALSIALALAALASYQSQKARK